MNDEQANKIIDEVLKAHWPNWNFAGEELVVWLRELRKFNFDSAREAINNLYVSWEKERYPKMPHILAATRNLSREKWQANKRLVPLFEITDEEGRPRWRTFVGDANMPREEVTKIAEKIQTEANRLFPGTRHIVFYFSTDEKPEDDSDYYGPDARQRAIESILKRPDSDKTKQWLQTYIVKRKSKKKNDEPALIGDDIPF